MIDTAAIRRRREKLGLSFAAAALAAGWQQSARATWQKIESGRRTNPTVQTLEAMAGVLGCKAKDLLR